MIVINLKNYKSGKEVLKLAKVIQKYLPKAIICPDVMDMDEVASKTKLIVYAQHVDSAKGDRATGFIVPQVIKRMRIKGTLLNHSEHRLSYVKLKESFRAASKAGLKTIVCVPSLSYARAVRRLKPYAIAFEDKKLIGSGKSITQYRSGAVARFAEKLKGSGIKALCGAGINSAEDVKAARDLGCDGVLIASAIAKPKVEKAEKLIKEISRI